jgi:hypothetical protein
MSAQVDMPHLSEHQALEVGIAALTVLVLLLLGVKKTRQWIKRRFKELDFLEEYFPLLFTRWQAAIWGGSVLAVAFGWRFITSDWPYPVKLTACVVALFFAGYYVWRAEHIRLVPKLELLAPITIYTTTNVAQLNRKFVQLPANCLTEARLENCGGQLLRVWRWVNGAWQLTQVDEPLDLNWSILDMPTTFLERAVLRRLNIFFVENVNRNISFASNRIPLRMALSSSPTDVLRFDIRVAGQDCPPKHVSLKIILGQNWDDVAVEEMQN